MRPATRSDAPLLEVLLQDYLAEFATFSTVPTGEDGRYVYPYLPHYWRDPDRHPFLIHVDGEPAGFALLRNEADPSNGRPVMHLAEFYVIEAARRLRVGTTAAETLWDRFPGHWSLGVLTANRKAYPFWKQAIGHYTRNHYVEKPPADAPGGMYTFLFDSGGAGPGS